MENVIEGGGQKNSLYLYKYMKNCAKCNGKNLTSKKESGILTRHALRGRVSDAKVNQITGGEN